MPQRAGQKQNWDLASPPRSGVNHSIAEPLTCDGGAFLSVSSPFLARSLRCAINRRIHRRTGIMSPHHRSPIAKRCVYIVLATEVLDAQLDLPRLHPLGRGSLLDTLGCVLLDALHWRLGTYHDHFIKLAMMHERAYDPLQLGANALSRYAQRPNRPSNCRRAIRL